MALYYIAKAKRQSIAPGRRSIDRGPLCVGLPQTLVVSISISLVREMAAVKNGVPEEPQGIWGASAEIAVLQPLMPEVDGATLLYNTNLKARARAAGAARRGRLGTARCEASLRVRAAPPPRLAQPARPPAAQVPIYTEVNVNPKAVEHSTEWPKILAGDPGATPRLPTPPPARAHGPPVLIPEDDGDGMKVMTIDEWTYNWKVRLPPPRKRPVPLTRRAAQRRLPGLPGLRLAPHA